MLKVLLYLLLGYVFAALYERLITAVTMKSKLMLFGYRLQNSFTDGFVFISKG